MRAVLQRVSRVRLTINNTIERKIGKGLLVLLAIENSDNNEDLLWLSKKIIMLRIFNDSNEVMNKNILDVQGEIILVSQFTLFASTIKGNRPSYSRASKPENAIKLYNKFVNQLENDFGKHIQTGEFGANMQIELVNDGPVTIIIDTKNKE